MQSYVQSHIQPVVDKWNREKINHGGRNGRKRLLDSKKGDDPALMRHNEKRRKSITMKLSKSGESKVIGYVQCGFSIHRSNLVSTMFKCVHTQNYED